MQAGYTVLAACRTPSKATELQQLAKEHPGQLHLLTLDVTDEKSIEVQRLWCFWLCTQMEDKECFRCTTRCSLTSALQWPVQAAAAEAAKLCPDGIDVLINNAGELHPGEGPGFEMLCQSSQEALS